MSQSEVERFAKDLQANAALQEAANEHKALAATVSFAVNKGYGFTVEEAKAHLRSQAKADGKELSDAELDAVAGGVMWA
jgi:predicted ribosomally synthesized peptide with nif11-like leader